MQHAHAIANDLEGEDLAVVAVERFAGQHGRLDLEDVVARVVGREVEDDAFSCGDSLRRITALASIRRPSRSSDTSTMRPPKPAVAEDGLQLHRRAHEGEVVGQHGGHGQIAQLFFPDEDRVHGRGQRLERLARVGVERAAADAAGVDAVGDEHHGAEVAAGEARAQLGQGLADARGLGLGRGQEARVAGARTSPKP